MDSEFEEHMKRMNAICWNIKDIAGVDIFGSAVFLTGRRRLVPHNRIMFSQDYELDTGNIYAAEVYSGVEGWDRLTNEETAFLWRLLFRKCFYSRKDFSCL